MEEKKLALINALTVEHDRMVKDKQTINETDFQLTIEYLKTGKIPEQVKPEQFDDYDFLYAAINDFDCLYNDYCS